VVMRAADEVGCTLLEELTLLAPLPVSNAVQMRVIVGAAGARAERPVSVYSRPEIVGALTDSDWALHAEGIVAPAPHPGTAVTESADCGHWPPADARAVDLDGIYERLEQSGYYYGPSYRGLRAVWQRGSDIFVDAALAEAEGDVTAYGLHPVLLDAVLQGVAIAADAVENGESEPRMPFSWEHVQLHAVGAAGLRARISTEPSGSAVSIQAVDHSGHPVISIGSLASRPLPPIDERYPRRAPRGFGARARAAPPPPPRPP
ncbi:polyketide synthase dehydratase domain-containing protein, partial [Nocardia sp. NPDC058497]|uniref:polyketide synthase dehydratase domain-containing protein n=1 Tax=Nocardia sp. NPDC058497 TaxID=3346529 RepID=UPI00365AE4E3